MRTTYSQLPENQEDNWNTSPAEWLTKKEVDLQNISKIFKNVFNLFYKKSLRSFGKWRTQENPPSIGTVVLILDKSLDRQYFLEKLKLGKISQNSSSVVVEVIFIKQTHNVTIH